MSGKILGFLRPMTASRAAVLVCALIVSPSAFSSSVTYDYTGVITSFYDAGENFKIALGSQLSGTYTFDLANGNPAQSSGTIGSANWTVVSQGGAGYSLPLPISVVFASTAQVGGFVYATPVPPVDGGIGTSFAGSSVQGSAHSGAGSGSTFTAGEAWSIFPDINGNSSLSISNPHGAYSANGLPILAGATSATGEVDTFIANSPTSIEFNVTSLTRAPEIDPASAASGVTLLLGALAIVLGPRRSLSP